MQVSISSITIPPAHPGGFAPKTCPHPGAFASKLLHGGRGFVGQLGEGRAFVYKRCLPFFEIFIIMEELATDNTLGFTCCSEILYIL